MLAMTLYTSVKAPLPVRRGANQVVGQPGSVRSSRVLCTSAGRSTDQPSATMRTGPSPLTMFRRIMVTGAPPLVT